MDLDLNSIVEFNPKSEDVKDELAHHIQNIKQYIQTLEQSRINQMHNMITTINMLLEIDDHRAIHRILEQVKLSYIEIITEQIKTDVEAEEYADTFDNNNP